MTEIDDFKPEIKVLRGRISALDAASLRVGSSLDLDTVLREIAESARALTAARYAVITTIGDEGELEDVVMSGFTPEEERLVRAWDDGVKVFDVLRDLPSPLRVADMPAYVGALGFSSDGAIINTFQGTPMRHRDVQIGNFFLGEKEGRREFTEEDEELLVLFASQAAAAIANARTYRAEQRARANLEALVETSPYGVLVFHVPTGHPVSVIREAYRLAERHFVEGGVNRVVLATDGDFNVGISDPDALERYIARKREIGVSPSVLGFGTGSYNDALMQRLAQHGDGNAAYIDSLSEAR